MIAPHQADWSREYLADLFANGEQEPLIVNSVSIVDESNAAGLFRLRIECAFSALDLMSVYKTTRLMGEILYVNNVGMVKIDNDGIFRRPDGQGHTMGTTRMGDSIQDSVCDKNCRVHNYSNLYLAGSSVFTTSSYARPTVTIVALAQRLADHLSKS
jgi:choline dehydrogenase-like flavoprotein